MIGIFCLIDDYISGTDGPRLGAWTSISQFTEAEDSMAPMSKSTRHVASESKNIYYTPKIPPKQAIHRQTDFDYSELNHQNKVKGTVDAIVDKNLLFLIFYAGREGDLTLIFDNLPKSLWFQIYTT